MKLEVNLKCVPPKTTAQQKRVRFNPKTGKPVWFHGKKHSEAEELLVSLLASVQPDEPVGSPVRLTLEATWPWRKSDLATREKRAFAQKMGRVPCCEKPDADNFAKIVIDLLVSLRFIPDDKCIFDLRVIEWFGESPGIRIEIEQVVYGG